MSKPNLALPAEIPLKASSSKRIDSSRELVPFLACLLPSFQSSKQKQFKKEKFLKMWPPKKKNSHANSASDYFRGKFSPIFQKYFQKSSQLLTI
jgi:hypothetical protein